jgi:hypothetical protein
MSQPGVPNLEDKRGLCKGDRSFRKLNKNWNKNKNKIK